jgi:hypothetical protein
MIRAGDIVRARKLRENDNQTIRRWGRKGIFDNAMNSGIPLAWPTPGLDTAWLVIDDVCPEIYGMTFSHSASELVGRRFYKCRNSNGDIKIFPDFTITKI